jgi:hypothetical protein
MTCEFCERVATRLCDQILEHPKGDFGYILPDLDPEMCDAPLCDQHANVAGHFCGPGGCDTRDLCPPCYAAQHGTRLEVAR